jgi:lysophospholipase L1-like esterase
MILLGRLVLLVMLVLASIEAKAETLTSSNVQITWKVSNRFRLFRNPDLFKQQELAWRQYGQHVNQRSGSTEDSAMFYYNSSVLGTEHVLNDRRIPFTNILRTKFDWRGWAASVVNQTCWNEKQRRHTACSDIETYVNPKFHEIEMQLKPLSGKNTVSEYNCIWHVGTAKEIQAPCDETVKAYLPYPEGAAISVNVEGERPISIDAKVKDVLILGLGDSFASGEGNPDIPVALDENHRSQNLYPARTNGDVSGSAIWLDQLCHRSLYSHQLRAALQIGIENPHGAVTFMGYSCSGASVDKGILGPQSYVEFVSDPNNRNADSRVQASYGGKKDSQLYWALRELCKVDLAKDNGTWVCPDQQFRRKVDFVFLSIGGNDVGFANLVAWSTLRDGASSVLAKFFGATVPADQFAANVKNDLGAAYGRLAHALERSIPLSNGEMAYDPSRIILTAYPDILVDENGKTCDGVGGSDQPEDAYPANQSLDRFSSWLVVAKDKLDAAHAQLDVLHRRMGELAEANGWTYAGRAYNDQPFRGHGFCAQRKDRADDPAEMLMIPCWGKASRPTLSCQSGIFGQGTGWRPYDPATQNYPYALRQRWVRSFNDAVMVINQKVVDKYGSIDEPTSQANFSETTGAMHPSAEGHASMADAILIDLRPELAKVFSEN